MKNPSNLLRYPPVPSHPSGQDHAASAVCLRGSFRGFTLTELLVAMVILITLAVFAFNMTASAIYSARVSTTVSNLRQIGLANINFAQEQNGEICGLGYKSLPSFGRSDLLPYDWRLGAYAGAEMTYNNGTALQWSDVARALAPLYHPHIPKEITWLPKHYRFSVALNGAFSAWPGAGNESVFPRLGKFGDPGNTIYACSGIFVVDANSASDPSRLKLPTGGPWNRGPYFTRKRQLPVVFLDGSSRLVDFPVNRRLFGSD